MAAAPGSLTSQITHATISVSGSWATVAKNSSKSLAFHPPVLENGKLKEKVPRAVREEGVKLWEDCLIGTFTDDDVPNYGRILSMADCVWGRRCSVSVTSLGTKSFLFKIPDSGTRDWVLNSSHWHVAHKMLVMGKWEPDYKEVKQEPKSVPIWVKLWGVPMDVFSAEGLAYIASAIGVPLALDKGTEERTSVNYAKLCVEIEAAAAQDLPETIPVDIESCPSVDVRVEYPWLPTFCSTCNKQGHTAHNCKSRKNKLQPNKKEWVKVAEINKRKQPNVSSRQVNDVPNVESTLLACHEVLPVQKENQPVKPVLHYETLLTAQEETTVSVMEQGPIEKQNTFEPLGSINDEQAFPLQVPSVSPKSLRKPRQASLGVAAATKALAPRRRNCKKISNPSSEVSLLPYHK
ncbi:hypothetical protein SLE2022_308550 [Rubroshorea leprosula]